MPFLFISFLFFALSPIVCAASAHPANVHASRSALPANWFHSSDHPVHALFRRQSQNSTNITTDGNSYPPVGSSAWVNSFPQPPQAGPLGPGILPQSWKDFLDAVVQNGTIPNIPQTTVVNGSPAYPTGIDPNSASVCSAYEKQCRIDGDIWDAPEGNVALAFDDGPYEGSALLYNFLQTENLRVTHFFIGKNILANPQLFLTAFDVLRDDIAVHTYTHPLLTTLSNEQIFAELAYTMQIIHDSTGGRLPRFYRPPYGDADARVHAIAKCLGLTTIVWNQDTEDWQLPNGTTPAQISNKMKTWLSGNKNPGLVMLEHELSNGSAQAFIDNYHFIPDNGWKTMSAVDIDGLDAPYQNGQGTTGPVRFAPIIPNQGNVTYSLSPTYSTATYSTSSPASSGASSGIAGSSKQNGAGRTSSLAVFALSITVFGSVAAWQF
ncbi:hypothetical protein BC827DRAFT_1125543 [Russula dissimulans]|nr:hypothetical protein BC827DRAFT_1125543 [Russula dissimulans]